MRTFTALALSTLAAAAALPVAAQKLVPGLWETTMNMQSSDKQMQAQMTQMREQMAKLPPDQRKMMEDMMAKQGVGIGAAGNTMRYCLGKEQADRADVPTDNDGRCKRESLDRSGSTMRFKIVCTNPPSTGTGEITFKGDKAYDMKMSFEHPRQGKVDRMDMTGAAKWVSSDCGNLKPVGSAKP
ncbi:MAG: DUF3617 domain-containing protein [Rubrivivax sp.]